MRKGIILFASMLLLFNSSYATAQKNGNNITSDKIKSSIVHIRPGFPDVTSGISKAVSAFTGLGPRPKIGVLFVYAGENTYYAHDWVSQYWVNIFPDNLPPGSTRTKPGSTRTKPGWDG